mgnify:CR=1 FL=1
MSEDNGKKISISRREALKTFGTITGGATTVVTVVGALYGLSQERTDKEETAGLLQAFKGKIEPVSPETEDQLDHRLAELGIDLNNVSTFKIKVNEEGGIGFAETRFALLGRTEDKNPRMFIQDQNNNFLELSYWRTPDAEGEVVNWYIPGEDVEDGKGIPGAVGMQDILAYRITKDRQFGSDLYYLPPESELPALRQLNDLGGQMVTVSLDGLTSESKQRLISVKP